MYYVCIVSNSSSGYNFVQSIAIILSPEVKRAKSERTIINMRAFCVPQVPFAFESQSERPNGNSPTKLPFVRFGKVSQTAEW